jgi:hypothetical protein
MPGAGMPGAPGVAPGAPAPRRIPGAPAGPTGQPPGAIRITPDERTGRYTVEEDVTQIIGRRGPEAVEQFTGMVGHLTRLCFDSHAAGVMAVGALKDEVRRKPAETVKDLEDQLAKTKSLGLRNALRLTLKDLYKRENDDAKVLEQLRALIAENDAALQAEKK